MLKFSPMLVPLLVMGLAQSFAQADPSADLRACLNAENEAGKPCSRAQPDILFKQALRSVIVTTDCGADIDDQWVIAHLAVTDQVNTLGAIGNFAPDPYNIRGADTAACVRDVLTHVGRTNAFPVYAGADGPLGDALTPAVNEGVAFILERSLGFSPAHRLVVMGLGPITDVASAILLDPSVVDRIEVVALAFDNYPAGGDGWNVRNDVTAWKVVLEANVPVAAASGTLALAALNLSRADAHAMMDPLGPAGQYLAALHSSFLDRFGKVFAPETGVDMWPIWDEAVTATVLGMSSQRERPRPDLADTASFIFPNPRSAASFQWVDSIDRERVFGDLTARLKGR